MLKFKIEQIIYIKMDLALNNLQRLICHETNQTKLNQTKVLNKTLKYFQHFQFNWVSQQIKTKLYPIFSKLIGPLIQFESGYLGNQWQIVENVITLLINNE